MSIDEIAIIASLITGFATLTVAAFLAFQLRLQHIDSKTDLELNSERKNVQETLPEPRKKI